ncbi:MAG: hypothetical protein HY866_23800, partial [Chloroflexi bacterium]|nr:hypothetical protein [Chloroflexota bacterium]
MISTGGNITPMHRQLHLIILTVLMAALLAGCGGNKQDDNEDLPEARPL